LKTLVIIPTYNERENLSRLVPEVLDLERTLEILVVDDGSPDGTGELADEMAGATGRVHVLHRPKKLGLGSASRGNFPDISFGDAVNGISTTTIGYNSGGYYVGNTYILSDSMDWIKGRHNIKFGGEFWYMQHNAPSDNDMFSFDFQNWTTGHPKAGYQNKVGFGFASFLLGEVDSASRNVPAAQYGRRDYMAFYVNDDFKVSHNTVAAITMNSEFISNEVSFTRKPDN